MSYSTVAEIFTFLSFVYLHNLAKHLNIDEQHQSGVPGPISI